MGEGTLGNGGKVGKGRERKVSWEAFYIMRIGAVHLFVDLHYLDAPDRHGVNRWKECLRLIGWMNLSPTKGNECTSSLLYVANNNLYSYFEPVLFLYSVIINVGKCDDAF